MSNSKFGLDKLKSWLSKIGRKSSPNLSTSQLNSSPAISPKVPPIAVNFSYEKTKLLLETQIVDNPDILNGNQDPQNEITDVMDVSHVDIKVDKPHQDPATPINGIPNQITNEKPLPDTNQQNPSIPTDSFDINREKGLSESIFTALEKPLPLSFEDKKLTDSIILLEIKENEQPEPIFLTKDPSSTEAEAVTKLESNVNMVPEPDIEPSSEVQIDPESDIQIDLESEMKIEPSQDLNIKVAEMIRVHNLLLDSETDNKLENIDSVSNESETTEAHWVPAHIHPELHQKEFQIWLKQQPLFSEFQDEKLLLPPRLSSLKRTKSFIQSHKIITPENIDQEARRRSIQPDLFNHRFIDNSLTDNILPRPANFHPRRSKSTLSKRISKYEPSQLFQETKHTHRETNHINSINLQETTMITSNTESTDNISALNGIQINSFIETTIEISEEKTSNSINENNQIQESITHSPPETLYVSNNIDPTHTEPINVIGFESFLDKKRSWEFTDEDKEFIVGTLKDLSRVTSLRNLTNLDLSETKKSDSDMNDINNFNEATKSTNQDIITLIKPSSSINQHIIPNRIAQINEDRDSPTYQDIVNNDKKKDSDNKNSEPFLPQIGFSPKLKKKWSWLTKLKPKLSSSHSNIKEKIHTPTPIDRIFVRVDDEEFTMLRSDLIEVNINGVNRFPLYVEKYIYRLSHFKLSQPRKSLRYQVVVSNFMLSIISLNADLNFGARPATLSPLKKLKPPRTKRKPLQFVRKPGRNGREAVEEQMNSLGVEEDEDYEPDSPMPLDEDDDVPLFVLKSTKRTLVEIQ